MFSKVLITPGRNRRPSSELRELECSPSLCTANSTAMPMCGSPAAYALGGQTAAESYLNTDASSTRRNSADGVHPGYGFSENADSPEHHRRG